MNYLLSFAITVAAVWTSVVIVNSLVDPYGFNTLEISETLNGSKAALHHQQRASKAFAIAERAPRTLILGNSRPGHAIDIRHPGLARLPGRAFNGAFDGAHIQEISTYLTHAFYAAKTSHVVIGLELSSFGKFDPQPAYRPEMLARSDSQNKTLRQLTYLRMYGGMDALLDSYRSFGARKSTRKWERDSGRRTDATFLERLESCGSTLESFRVRESRDVRLNGIGNLTRSTIENSLETYRGLLEFAYKNDIALKLFISPVHARSLVLIGLLGKQDIYDFWERGLVEINESVAQQYAKAAYPLWDFSGYNAVTTEAIPAAHPKQQMVGYWEGSHYKVSVGNLILDRMYDSATSGAPMPHEFGNRLTSENLAGHLAEQASARDQYMHRNGDQASDLNATVSSKGAYSVKPGCAVL